MTCTNCNTKLSCGCQKKTASDGKQVCAACITSYETKLKQSQTNLKKFTK
jgi:transcription elongation factor Elf1